jgi:hypothetical protein
VDVGTRALKEGDGEAEVEGRDETLDIDVADERYLRPRATWAINYSEGRLILFDAPQ